MDRDASSDAFTVYPDTWVVSLEIVNKTRIVCCQRVDREIDHQRRKQLTRAATRFCKAIAMLFSSACKKDSLW